MDDIGGLFAEVAEAAAYDADAVLDVLWEAGRAAKGAWPAFLLAHSHDIARRGPTALIAHALAYGRTSPITAAARAAIAAGRVPWVPIPGEVPEVPAPLPHVLTRPEVRPEAVGPCGDRVIDRDERAQLGIRSLRSGRRRILAGLDVPYDDHGGWYRTRNLHAAFDDAGETVFAIHNAPSPAPPAAKALAWRTDGAPVGPPTALPWAVRYARWVPGDPAVVLIVPALYQDDGVPLLAIWAPASGQLWFDARHWGDIYRMLAPIRVDLPDKTFVLSHPAPLGRWRARDGVPIRSEEGTIVAVGPDRRIGVEVAPRGAQIRLVTLQTLQIRDLLAPPPAGWGWPDPCPAREGDWAEGGWHFVDDLLIGASTSPAQGRRAAVVWRLVDGGYEGEIGVLGTSAARLHQAPGAPQPAVALGRSAFALAAQSGRGGHVDRSGAGVEVWDPRRCRRRVGFDARVGFLLAAPGGHLIGVAFDEAEPFESDLLQGITIWRP